MCGPGAPAGKTVADPVSTIDLRLRTIRTAPHKLTLETNSGAGELYDLSNDPQEMDNRFGDPGVATVQRALEDMIRSRPKDQIAPLPQAGMIWP